MNQNSHLKSKSKLPWLKLFSAALLFLASGLLCYGFFLYLKSSLFEVDRNATPLVFSLPPRMLAQAIAQWLIVDMFGITALFIPLILMVVARALLFPRKYPLWPQLGFLLFPLLWGAFMFGYLYLENFISSTLLAGQGGIEFARLLDKTLGRGVLPLLFLLLLLYLFIGYLKYRTVSKVDSTAAPSDASILPPYKLRRMGKTVSSSTQINNSWMSKKEEPSIQFVDQDTPGSVTISQETFLALLDSAKKGERFVQSTTDQNVQDLQLQQAKKAGEETIDLLKKS